MNLQRRIEQLEARMGITPGRPHLIITNVRFADDALELVPGVYIEVFGRPLTPEEFNQVHADWEREHGVER